LGETWEKPKCRRKYQALEQEFSLPAVLIEAASEAARIGFGVGLCAGCSTHFLAMLQRFVNHSAG